MKHSLILSRTEVTVIAVEIEAATRDEAYEKAQNMLDDEDNPVDWDAGKVVHGEEDVLFN